MSNIPSKVDGLSMDELVKGLRELKIKMAKLQEKRQTLGDATK